MVHPITSGEFNFLCTEMAQRPPPGKPKSVTDREISNLLFSIVYTWFAFLFVTGCSSEVNPGRSPDPMPGIAFVSERDGNQEIYLIQADGSGLTRLTDSPEVDSSPYWSPDGLQIAFRSRREGSSDIFIMGADGSQPVNLVSDPEDSIYDEFNPTWHPDGDRLAIYTDRFPPASGCATGVHQLALMPVSGGSENIELAGALAGNQASFSWSPDGQRLAFSSICSGVYSHIYIWEIKTGTVIQFTEGSHHNLLPAWSPNGQQIAYTTNRDGNLEIYLYRLGTSQTTNLTQHPGLDQHPTWSPDGYHIAFTSDRDGNHDIFVMDSDGGSPHNLTQSPASDSRPSWSPVP
jgi:Tol biopolymer transport system component